MGRIIDCHHSTIVLLGAVQGKIRKTVYCPIAFQDKDMAHAEMSSGCKGVGNCCLQLSQQTVVCILFILPIMACLSLTEASSSFILVCVFKLTSGNREFSKLLFRMCLYSSPVSLFLE